MRNLTAEASEQGLKTASDQSYALEEGVRQVRQHQNEM
jgi:hypothetical protein